MYQPPKRNELPTLCYHLSAKSANSKTGPIAVTTSPTCPRSCPLLGQCYAASGKLSMHWKKVREGERGTDFRQHCRDIKALPAGRPIRVNQAGDLPSKRGRMDMAKYRQLDAACKGRTAWTYSHHRVEDVAAAARIRKSLVVNFSADSVSDAVKYHKNGTPSVCILPRGTTRDQARALGVTLCPAQTSETLTCADCLLCAKPQRAHPVGFIAHGATAAKVESRLGI